MKKMNLLLVVLFLFGVVAAEPEIIKHKIKDSIRTINELKLKLGLEKDQYEQLQKIYSASESQKKIDIDIFRSSSTALIRAAERRREITDSRVSEILTDLQNISFDKYRHERKKEEEMFRLKEGLILSRQQEIQIELIMAEDKDILDRLYARLSYYIKSGQDRKKKSSESGKLLKSRTGGLERRNPEVVRMEQGPPERILEYRNEKAKRVNKYLTIDQKKLYSELLKFQEQELRSYIRKLRR
ncbi:MAG: hypothetical protein KAS21_11165 [Candidatus Aminicenantes bacterium]|nr:hypothetical protein [Candidatus Aminicenantes bacterium]